MKPFKSEVPSTGNPTGDLDFELNGETKEAIEAVEGDVSDVLDVRGPSDLHLVMDGRDHVFRRPVHPASHHRPPQRRQQESHQRQLPLLLRLRLLLLLRRRPRPLPAASAALRHHHQPRHSLSLYLSLCETHRETNGVVLCFKF